MTPPADRPARFGAGRLPPFVSDVVGYFGISALALGADYSGLILLHRGLGLHYLAAATISFVAGLAVAWWLSTTILFRGRRKLSVGHEILGFCLTGLAGLLITQGAMAILVGGMGMTAELAKIPVAGGVFAFNFLSRRLLFASPTAA